MAYYEPVDVFSYDILGKPSYESDISYVKHEDISFNGTREELEEHFAFLIEDGFHHPFLELISNTEVVSSIIVDFEHKMVGMECFSNAEPEEVEFVGDDERWNLFSAHEMKGEEHKNEQEHLLNYIKGI